MDTITLTIDGKEVKTAQGKTVFEAAQDAGIYIPNLCILRYMKLPVGACRLCVVEVEGEKGPVGACTLQAKDGMVVHTHTPKLADLRRKLLGNILAQHPNLCLSCHRRERCKPTDICLRKAEVTEHHCVTCPKNGRCELQRVVDYMGMEGQALPYGYKGLPIERENPFIVRNNNLCILCGRCVWACREVLGTQAIDFAGQGREAVIAPASGTTLAESGCTFCGSCVEVCPTGALMDRDDQWHPWPDKKAALIRCQYACPAGIDVPRYIRFITEGKYTEALAVNREKVPFAAILSLVCAHPCEAACRRGELDQPLAIRALKRLAVERGDTARFDSGEIAPASGRRVAVVGSGPAGLTAAYYLAKKGGHAVTIFEALPQAGGMLRVGIPEFRLPRQVLEAEIGIVTNLGVNIKTDTKVESLDSLFQEGYQAIFLAIGAHGGTRLGIDGEDLPGVVDGLSFLRQVHMGQKVQIGERVAVIGGGHAALDSARIARRLGAGEVSLIYPGTREELTATAEEVEEAVAEGIELHLLASPSRIEGAEGGLRLHCRRQGGPELVLKADMVIVAMGQLPQVPEQWGLALQEGGTLRVDAETLQTSREGVFAGGDAVSGPATVIEAIAAGRRAAISIDKYLGGQGDIEESFAPQMSLWVGRDEGFAQRRRQAVPLRDAQQRIGDFGPVEQGYSEGMAVEEARRCMGCSRRFLVAAMMAQPERAKVAQE
ncbi:MAG TPA: FAD-dependent oxidoreductase [Dehalococcoidia bacterium]|nr:FAD-dependent oxidoreductase [Dehalococcoidia bacterium]